MPSSVKCHSCGTNYKAATAKSRSPVCNQPQEEPDDEPVVRAKGKKTVVAKTKEPVKCPMCKKTLAPGVKFCAACGTNVGTSDAGDAFVAGSKLEEKSAKDMANARWQM